MTLIVPKSDGGERILAPEGNHLAICTKMIHIGTIETEYMGEKKQQNKIMLYFELCHEKVVFKEENGEENFLISQEYTFIFSDKSNLLKQINGWRGTPLNQEQIDNFDVHVLLGKPCMVQVVHKISAANNPYTQISNISSLPKGTTVPDRVNDIFHFSINEWDAMKFELLPDFIKDKIKTSAEYVGLQNNHATEEAHEMGDTGDEPADDLPF